MEFSIRAVSVPKLSYAANKANVVSIPCQDVDQTLRYGVVPGVPLRFLADVMPANFTHDLNDGTLMSKSKIVGADMLKRLAASEISDVTDMLVLRGAYEYLAIIGDFLSKISSNVACAELAKRIFDFSRTYVWSAIKNLHSNASAPLAVKVQRGTLSVTSGAFDYTSDELNRLQRWGLTAAQRSAMDKFVCPCLDLDFGAYDFQLDPGALQACYELVLDRFAFNAIAQESEFNHGPYAWMNHHNRDVHHVSNFSCKLIGETLLPAPAGCYARKEALIPVEIAGIAVPDSALETSCVLSLNSLPFTSEIVAYIPTAGNLKSSTDFTVLAAHLELKMEKKKEIMVFEPKTTFGGEY